MTIRIQDTATEVCEMLLNRERQYNTEHKCAGSQTVVADRLLCRSLELNSVYAEVYERLRQDEQMTWVFLRTVLAVAAYWNPQKLEAARGARNELSETNRRIALVAGELAALLERRSTLHNSSGFASETHYDVCEVLEAAGANNYLFRSWIAKNFARVRAGFDLKYWPTLSEFIDVSPPTRTAPSVHRLTRLRQRARRVHGLPWPTTSKRS